MINKQRESLHWIARHLETQLEKARGKAELSHRATGLTKALALSGTAEVSYTGLQRPKDTARNQRTRMQCVRPDPEG